ncbi:MAG: ABC transporter ATP-binding protein/permease [Mogibacterium sp.]|nr:ABC transporter ATP-binding protein/permease [Mogibacterium sp.]
MSHTIELKKVSKFYSGKDTVSTGFSRVDLALDMGEFVVITGESGSGKSTLLNVISGLDTYEEGEMFVCGEDTSGYRTEDYERYRKTYIGNIFQDFNLINSYSVYQNIELSMLITGHRGKECRDRVLELIDLVDLGEYRRTKASRLSGGQKQRVAIARALAMDAPIIVADEPTGNLDSESARKVMETLARISKDKLVVIVTHNFEQAEPYVTRKLTMHDGRIIEDKRIRRADRADAAPDLADGTPQDDAAQDDAAAPVATVGDLYDALTDLYEEEPASHFGSSLTDTQLANLARRGARFQRREAELAAETERIEADAQTDRSASQTDKMRLFPQYRLGVRNTFNIPAKFFLLLLVYLFVATAVISQYASTVENMHQNENLGWNDFFNNSSVNRIILKREDGKAFTDEDIEAISGIENIDYVVKNDLGLDTGILCESNDIDISGPTYPLDLVDPATITMGAMPEGDYDVIIEVTQDSWAYDTIQMLGEELIGRQYYILSYGGIVDYGERLIDKKIRIAGVIVREETEGNSTGEARIYISDKLADKIQIKSVAAMSKVTVNFSGTKAKYDSGYVLVTTPEVDEGECYITEETAYSFYDNGYARGEDITITVDNMYFKSSKDLTITVVVAPENIEYWLGYDRGDYDMYVEKIFINPKDFTRLYNKGDFQISVFMIDETQSDDTVAALQEAGYTTFVMKESLHDVTGGYEFIINLLTKLRLMFLFIVLFFIAYAVIRLIMRSRNTYYSTLRILGANKSNTSRILRTELVLMMLIACGICGLLIYLLLTGRIETEYTKYFIERLKFLKNRDYVLLFAAMLLMSLMIAQRYSRKIFKDSAMNVFREEV